jgi:hypothetical protein
MVSEDQEGFLVSDGHLSDEEYNFSEHSDQINRKDEIEQRRLRYKEIQSITGQRNYSGLPLIL